MSKALPSIIAIVAAGAATFAVIQFNARSAAEAAALERQRSLAAAEQSLREALDTAARAKDELAAEKDNVARLKKERDDALAKAKLAGTPGAPGAPSADGKPQMDIRGMMSGFAKAFDDPEQRKAMKGMQEQMVSGAYAKLFKELGLSDADAKLITELLGERNFLAMDKGRKLLTGKADDAAIADMRKDLAATKADYDSKVKAVLGDEKAQKLTEYEQTVGDRRSLDGLARDFDRKGYAFDDAQKDRLTKIMTEERLKNPSNDIPDMGGGPGMQLLMSDTEAKAQQQQEEEYQQRVLTRATEAGLSPDQVNALQESQKRQNERRTFSRTMGRAFLLPK
jgi:hypothetical protein